MKTMEQAGGRASRPRPAVSCADVVLRYAAHAHIFLQGNVPLAWMLVVLVACSVMSQVLIMMLSPSGYRDAATDHFMTFQKEGFSYRAPAVLYEHARFRGWELPVLENISDLRALDFRGLSSMRVSKGVTVVLFSNTSWRGAEFSIDAEVSYIGHDWNDRAKSVALEIEPVTPHAVEFYRAGASMGLEAMQCPRNVVCAPDATLDEVPNSVYMAVSNLMRETLAPLVGCRIHKFFRPDGRQIFGMLPAKVYYVCENEHFILPAEPPGFVVKVPVPSLFRRVHVETLATSPRVHRVAGLLGPDECQALMRRAQKALVKAGAPPPALRKEPLYQDKFAWAASLCGRGCADAKLPEDAVLVGLVTRAAELLRLPHDLAEGLLVRRYEMGTGEEAARYEWTAHAQGDAAGAERVNRFVSMFIFLNDVEQGGELSFPGHAGPAKAPGPGPAGGAATREDHTEAEGTAGKGLLVRPAAGDAVFIYNLVATGHWKGETDSEARVGALPVVRGEKWVAEVRFANRLDRIDEWNKAARQQAALLAARGMYGGGMNWRPLKVKHGEAPQRMEDVATQLQLGRVPVP